MKKICFVIQRYGLDVNGGAELLCRELAEHLSSRWDITVLTTKSKDYITWKNEYPMDDEVIHGIKVHRCNVSGRRNLKEAGQVAKVFRNEVIGNISKEKEWLKVQGPNCPEMIEWISKNKDNFDLFFFFTYIYYPFVFGASKVLDKAILVPMAHKEQYLEMSCLQHIFKNAAGIIYLTETEKKLVNRVFENEMVPSLVGACGIDIIKNADPNYITEKFHTKNYIVYVGRVDKAKQCDQLVQYFNEYHRRNITDLHLYFIGRNSIKLKESQYIHFLGFVTDEIKSNCIAGAKALVLPSPFESLSMVVLEAMGMGVPVIVNGWCDVTREHCIKSNAGLYYKNYFEFEGVLKRMRSDKEMILQMKENGRKYVADNYQWNIVIDKLVLFIEKVMKS